MYWPDDKEQSLWSECYRLIFYQIYHFKLPIIKVEKRTYILTPHIPYCLSNQHRSNRCLFSWRAYKQNGKDLLQTMISTHLSCHAWTWIPSPTSKVYIFQNFVPIHQYISISHNHMSLEQVLHNYYIPPQMCSSIPNRHGHFPNRARSKVPIFLIPKPLITHITPQKIPL